MAGGVPAAAPPAQKPVTILDAIEEAYRRGLPVPPDKEAIYNEAVKRGMVQDVRRSTMDRVVGDLQSFGEGAKNATVGLLNAPSAVARYARDKVGGAMGFTPEQLQAMDQMKSNWGIGTPQPTEDVLKRVETVTGKHEPINREERYFSAAGSGVPSILMGPGGWTQRIVSALSGGVGSEYGGEKMKSFGPGWELAGRIVGGMAGSSIPDLLRRGFTPMPINTERAANVRTLRDANIPITAGQKTGSHALKMTEEELGGGATRRIAQQQDEAFTRAAGAEAGMPVERLNPAAFQHAYREVDNTFTDLANRTHLPLDNQMQNELLDAVMRYQNSHGELIRGPENIMNDIARLAGANGGVLTGEQYRNITTSLREMAESNPALNGVVRDMRQALDGNIERNIAPGLREAWRAARTRYANLMVMQDAMTKAGEKANEGLVTPANLRGAVDANVSDRHILSGDSRLGNLARAGSNVMAPLANSNTAARQRIQQLGATALAVIGGTAGSAGGVPGAIKGGLIGAAAGIAAPLAIGRALMSRPVQAYLGNQVLTSRGLTSAQKGLITLMNNNPRIREYLVKLLEGNGNGP